MSNQQQSTKPAPPTPEQVYAQYNQNDLSNRQNDLNNRQMFEMVYNSLLKLQAENAQLIEQVSNLTKQKEPTKGKK